MVYLTQSPSQTEKIGENLAKNLLKKKARIIIGLTGNLGGGKTTFLKGFAKGLGIKEKIASPTFLIMKSFNVPKDEQLNPQRFSVFFHFDCYRIKKEKEILDIGFKNIVSNSENITAVEWSDKIRKIMPRDSIFIDFRFKNEKTREIFIGAAEKSKPK